MAASVECSEPVAEAGVWSLHAVRLQNLRWRLASAGREINRGELPPSLRGLAEDHRALRFDSPEPRPVARRPRSPSGPRAAGRRRPSWPSLRRPLASSGLAEAEPAVGGLARVKKAASIGELLEMEARLKKVASCGEMADTEARLKKIASCGELLDLEDPRQTRMKKSVSFSRMLEVEVPILIVQEKPRSREELARANLARLLANNERVMRRASNWKPPTLCEVRARLFGVAGCLIEGKALLICGRGKRTKAGDSRRRHSGGGRGNERRRQQCTAALPQKAGAAAAEGQAEHQGLGA